jgi:hypothetical protein
MSKFTNPIRVLTLLLAMACTIASGGKAQVTLLLHDVGKPTGLIPVSYGEEPAPKQDSVFLCPPTNLVADSIEDAAYLTWHKPLCNGQNVSFILDNGTMENGWSISPGYNDWLGNKFNITPGQTGVIQSLDMEWYNNPAATNQYFQVDIFSLSGTWLGQSAFFTVPVPAPAGFMNVPVNDIPFSGSFYAMIHWNDFSGVTHWLGFDEDGPYSLQNLGYYYDGYSFSPISLNTPGVFTLRANTVIAVPPPTGYPELMGYNIYRDSVYLKYIPGPDSLSTYDMNLDYGHYCYDIRAKYHLNADTIPTSYGESDNEPGGPACLTIHTCCGIPFFEPWDQGNFGFNGWVPGPNWTVTISDGNPMPCADFSQLPVVIGYDNSIESEWRDASWVGCAKVWMDFDYKLTDLNQTGNEKLAVEVYYDHVWHPVTEFSNTGNVPWTSQHFDISVVRGKAIKIRFRAHGNNSADIQHWDVDNIHLYAICNPARNLVVSDPGEIPGCTGINLSWSPPLCPDPGKLKSGRTTDLYGYDIYRKSSFDADFIKANTSIVTDTTWCDHDAPTGWNAYYVKAIFAAMSCDYADASNTDSTYVLVGIAEKERSNVLIFPNPADGSVTVKSSSAITGIEILDFTGQVISEIDPEHVNKATINTVHLPPGVHFVRINTMKGTVMRKITIIH